MRLRKNKPWTPDDTQRLQAFIAGGGSAFRAAAMFDRNINDIRSRARKLGTPFPTIRQAKKDAAERFSERSATS